MTDVAARRFRWKFPVLVLLIAVGLIIWMQRGEWVESYLAAYFTAAVSVLAVVVLMIWFGIRAPLTLGARLRGLVGFVTIVGLMAIALMAATRPDGVYTGVGVPRRVWKWSPRVGEAAASLPVVTNGGPVDLATTNPHDFPQFLGPARNNTIQGVGLSRDWSKPPRQLWKQPIGLGWASFAIVGPYAVTQEQRGDKELTVCYEVQTGKARWEHANDAHFSEWQGGDGPRATPTIAGGRVYVMGATGILDCLDGATGGVIWSHNILADAHGGNQTYGKSCSPLLVDDLVVVTGTSRGPSLMAYHATDGSPAWQGAGESPGYASPVLATLAGVRQILTINSDSAASHDLTDGHLLWRCDWPGSMPKNVNPIALDSERVLISAGYGLGTTLLRAQSNGGTLSVAREWTSRHLKPKFANNAVRGNYVFGLDDGVLTCLDVSTGKRMWRDGRYGFGEVLLVDDLLIVQTEPGDIALVDATPDRWHEIGTFKALDGKAWSCPALSGHYLLVRNDHQAACFELP